MAAKPKRLRKLRINRVDLVDRGANPDADVLLFKRDVEKQPLTTAQRNALPDSAFALIKPGGKKDDEGKTEPRSLRVLPFKKPNGDIDLPRLRNALSRLSQTDLTDAQQATARGKLRAAARQAQIGEFAKEIPMDKLLTSLRLRRDEELLKAVDWIEKIHQSLQEAIKKQEPDDPDEPEDRTFDDVMIRRSAHQVMQRVQEFAMALDETIARVVNNAKGGHMDQKVKDAVASFVRAVKADLPKFIDESMKGMQKADRLPEVVKLIAGELKMTDTKKVDKKKDDDKKPAADMGTIRKAFSAFARMMGASDADVAKIDPDASDDIWKGVTPALRARIEEGDRVRAEEVKKREAAEKRVATLERDATLAEVRKEVASYKHMGLDPAKDVELFEKMTAGLSEDQAKRMREIFLAADLQIETGKLFAEAGGAGLGMSEGGDSADAEIEKRVTGIMAKAENTKMTRDEAMDKIMREDPALWERYRRENAIKV